MRILSVDFGTTNTVAALAVDDRPARTVSFDGAPSLPSAVYLAADGTVSVGRDALRQARLDPSRFEPNPKRRIDDGEVLLGDRTVPVVEVIAAVLRQVAMEVRRQGGGVGPDQVRLTHPAAWGAARTNILLTAARLAGLGEHLVLIPEPVAAAAQYTGLPGRTLAPTEAIAVYDLGGGTLDVAVVARLDDGLRVLAEAGLADLGGLDFDQAVLEQVGRRVSSADPPRWQQLLRQSDLSSRRAARVLAEDVRAAKESLSRHPQTDVALPDPFPDAHLTRGEFESLIRPDLLRSVQLLQQTVKRSGVPGDRLAAIFLVGGSSRIPLVAGLIQQYLGVIPVALDEPEAAVALGALLVPVPGYGQRTRQLASGSASGSAPVPTPVRVSAGMPAEMSGAQRSVGVGLGGPWPAIGHPSPARRRRRWWLGGAAVVALLAAVLVLVLLQPFGSERQPDAATFAAEVEAGMRDVRTVTATVGGGTGRQATLKQTMDAGRLQSADIGYSMAVSGQNVAITIRIADGKTYLGGSALSSLLPSSAGGYRWMLIDGSSKDSTIAQIGSSLGPVLSNVGTDSYVYLLRGATSVSSNGPATVGSMPTTQYAVTIDVGKAAAALPAGLDGYRHLLSGATGEAHGSYWIDDRDRLVKAELTMPGTGRGQRTALTVTKFDDSFSIETPDPATVYRG